MFSRHFFAPVIFTAVWLNASGLFASNEVLLEKLNNLLLNERRAILGELSVGVSR